MKPDNLHESDVSPTRQQRGFMQHVSAIFGILSFLLAVASGVWLYLRVDETGFNNPISASIAACCFFFIFVGVVLTVIGYSNLPRFSFDQDQA